MSSVGSVVWGSLGGGCFSSSESLSEALRGVPLAFSAFMSARTERKEED